MIRISLLIAALCCASPALAQQEATWMRYPAISPDGSTVVFTYRGDLYRVPASGGVATQLTTHAAHDFMPVWSRDGRQIAFASDRHGNFDVFVMPVQGGEARRLTVHSADEYPYAFSADGKGVVYGASRLDAAESRLFPSGAQPELYQVSIEGGRPAQLLTTPAEAVAVSEDGRLMVYEDRKGGENAWRKHQTSSVARDLWVYDVASGTHRKLTTFAGEDRNPVFADGGSAVYYLSEQNGTMNVHRMAVSGGASTQVTRFTKGGPVRFLSRANNGTLAFAQGGDLYTMAPNGEPRRVPVTIVGDAAVNRESVVTFSSGAREAVLSPNGKEVAFIYRGDVFVASVSGGTTKQVTRTPEVETGVTFSPDGSTLLYASERGGRWGIYQARRVRAEEPYFFASTLLEEAPVVVNEHQNFQPSFSPDGRELAYIENFTNLRVRDLASGKTRTLLTEEELFGTGPGQRFEWSPDGQWLLFNYRVPGLAPGEVGLVRAAGGEPAINLTQSGFSDGSPTWIMGGKAMLWLSNRDGLRSMAMSGGNQRDAYAMFFTREGWDRFRLSKEDHALLEEAEKGAERGGTAKKASQPEPLALELDGARDRAARLTIHSSSMGGARLSAGGGTLYYHARFEKGMNLWSTNLRTKETKLALALDANGASMAWDSAQKKIFLVADGGMSLVDPSSGKRERIAIRGEMVADEDAERAAMFERVWRRTRDTYFTAGYHGADWLALGPEYEKYLSGVSNGHEFAELLSEMLGELNVSHSGARYSGRAENGDATASLGIFYDYAHRSAGVKVVEVMEGGPLDRPGMNVRPGAQITAIDGVAIGPEVDFAALLNRKAGKNVLLSVRDAGGKAERQIVVKPITPGEENRLLYARWVKRNELEVDRLSQGRLGYIHVPGMNDGAYRSTFEEVMGKYPHREGLVVDVRWNGGGDLVADLAMFLSGKRFFDYATDTRSTGFEPNFRWTKPSISLTNEAAYSDGHCFSWAYQHLGIGQLVGQSVPGTCTFAGWESLQNGVRWGVPGMGVKDADSGRYLENWQTEVDLPVWNEYEVVSRGKDQQLEAAIKALLERVRPRAEGAGTVEEGRGGQ
jgi:Tol biopolymer transport system component/C-terminal processing protease CtpA/Prc